MVILVNGEPAVIKENSSIEFVAENPDFKDVSDFTLSISFPIKGCEINKRIFGYLGRRDEPWPQRTFSATLMAGKFVRQGCLSIVEGSDEELKAQFLSGRSEANYKFKLDECYIDELELGSWQRRGINGVDMSALGGVESVALPWVNDESGNIQNVTLEQQSGPGGTGGMSGRHPEIVAALSQGRSYMPFMLFLAKKIAQAIGMSYDFSQWESSQKRFLLCCNALPPAWNIPEYARTLPHWSVQEFFRQLEYVLDGDFRFDFFNSKVSFCPRVSFDVVKIDRVIDGFTVEMSTDDVEYVGTDMVCYADRGDEQWKVESCQWIVDRAQVVEFGSFAQLNGFCHEHFSSYTTDGRPASWWLPDGIGRVYYAADIDTYFVMEIASKVKEGDVFRFTTRLRKVNVFAPRNYSSDEDAKSREIKIIPVRIDDADEYGETIFLAPKAYNESYSDDEEAIVQTPILRNIKRGKDAENPNYYDNIYVGYWYGGEDISVEARHCPDVDVVDIVNGWNLRRNPQGLRLRAGHGAKFGKKIEGKTKFIFYFLADGFYNPKSIFYIDGYYYVCEKITATINSYGLSQKFKGEFYRIQSEPS